MTFLSANNIENVMRNARLVVGRVSRRSGSAASPLRSAAAEMEKTA